MNLFIKRSSRKNKKYDLFRLTPEKPEYILSFGDNRYQDFTLHKDEKRKELYINRHKKMKTGINLVFILQGFGLNIFSGLNQQFNLQ
jgi:hypothetical protein